MIWRAREEVVSVDKLVWNCLGSMDRHYRHCQDRAKMAFSDPIKAFS